MRVLEITGGARRLEGELRIQGAKNAVLPILAAAVVGGGVSVIHNCPELRDVSATVRILEYLGCSVVREGGDIIVDSTSLARRDIPDSLMREMRSSVIFLGAILAREGVAQAAMPGGCELGPRPVDLHLAAFAEMGAEITEKGGNISCRCKRLRGCCVNLSFPSVGATENIMLAASRAEGTTTITNAAREPEIVDLQNFLRKMGVAISGAGTSVVTIEGASSLRGAEHTVIGDRIAASTYLAAAASAGGDVTLTGADPRHFQTVTDILTAAGCRVSVSPDAVRLVCDAPLRAVKPVVTRPYPGFPTDAQAPVMACLLKAAGSTVFVENIFENRYRHVQELKRLGADIKLEGRVAVVCSVPELHGASLCATDLRGGAAMAVAALGARGSTRLAGLEHIERGYERFAESLTHLGAEIRETDG